MIEPTSSGSRTNWTVEYEDVAPIDIRDPVAESLAVLDPGEPFVVDYADVVTLAGHSCPTAAGAFRMTQLGLAELYPEEHPVRGDVEVTAGGPKDDPTYGVTSRIVSAITGAAEEDGFGGLAGGYGDRTDLLHFASSAEPDPTYTFARTDTGDAVRVVYRVGDVPESGPATGHLRKLIDGTATDEERARFAEDWHGRVRAVLTDDDLFELSREE